MQSHLSTITHYVCCRKLMECPEEYPKRESIPGISVHHLSIGIYRGSFTQPCRSRCLHIAPLADGLLHFAFLLLILLLPCRSPLHRSPDTGSAPCGQVHVDACLTLHQSDLSFQSFLRGIECFVPCFPFLWCVAWEEGKAVHIGA